MTPLTTSPLVDAERRYARETALEEIREAVYRILVLAPGDSYCAGLESYEVRRKALNVYSKTAVCSEWAARGGEDWAKNVVYLAVSLDLLVTAVRNSTVHKTGHGVSARLRRPCALAKMLCEASPIDKDLYL